MVAKVLWRDAQGIEGAIELGAGEIRIAIDGRDALSLTVAEAEQAWGTAIEARMTARRTGAA